MIARRRLANQHLIGAPLASPEAVVRRLAAVQAQDYPGAKWAIGQRLRGGAQAVVDEALDAGRILRTHVLRPTWHIVLPEDARWMLRLTGPKVSERMAPYNRQLQLDAALLARSNDAMARALEGGKHLTRKELGDALEAAGLPARGQRLAHMTAQAELDQVVVSGAQRGKQQTYALFDERVPPAPARSRDEMLADLAARYFAAHGPALVHDFAWWSWLAVGEAKRAIEMAGLTRATLDGKTYWHAPPGRASRLRSPTVHLLPNYDEYFIAYKERDLAPVKLEARQLLTSHFVVLDGRMIGGWRRVPAKRGVVVDARLFRRLDAAARRALEREADRFGRFLGLPVELRVSLAR